MKTIISDKNTAESYVAEKLRTLLEKKPDAVLAFAGGRSLRGLYELLLAMYRAGELSFEKARVFAVAEYVGTEYRLSHKKTIFDDFLYLTDILPENCHVPAVEGTERYDELIASCGGIDLAILGLGENGHFGYNEPSTQFASLSHVQKLSEATKRQNALMFGGEDKVPDYAVTMGIRTITGAGDIAVLAFGESKAEAVHKMLYGRNDSVVPAAFLQIPMHVTVYLDDASSSQL